MFKGSSNFFNKFTAATKTFMRLKWHFCQPIPVKGKYKIFRESERTHQRTQPLECYFLCPNESLAKTCEDYWSFELYAFIMHPFHSALKCRTKSNDWLFIFKNGLIYVQTLLLTYFKICKYFLEKKAAMLKFLKQLIKIWSVSTRLCYQAFKQAWDIEYFNAETK